MTVGLAHPRLFAANAQVPAEGDILIEAPEGGWDRFLTVEVFLRKNRVNSPVHWPLRKAGSAPSTVKLTAAAPYVLLHYLVLSAEETAQLASGQYFIMATLDTTQGASDKSWKGLQTFAHVLWLTEKSDGIPAKKDCGFVLNSYEYLHTTGRDKGALQIIDEFLPKAPSGTAFACFAKRAALAEQAGDLKLARDYYFKANEEFFYAVAASERARKEGDLAPHYIVPTFGDDCNRLTEVVGSHPKGQSP
ncbi:hypothetical protein [Myxococcus sp. SDU36]|uniref:hypothetical protein n=1 Tax=Myxococcus sp. SDU36 TaxID=2831967 RepID=UPI002543C3D3|nr:hypothetical protein [Myxococcus sp. SDU36]WIG96209.1 hypothetical protein KGD87_01750 [Myxococcus sp. SDU36]